MRTFAIVAFVLLATSGCGRSKKTGPTSDPGAKTACNTNDDCPPRWVCLAHECANPSTSAHFTAPETAVTPDKVRRQLEQVNQQHEDKIDKVTHPPAE